MTEIMYFVPDRLAAAEWYAKVFRAEITVLENPEHFYIQVGNQDIWFHQADSKVGTGTVGQVAYWQVDDFNAALEHTVNCGAILYRGPLDRQDGSFMCQVQDPFGNLMGLIGPKPSS